MINSELSATVTEANRDRGSTASYTHIYIDIMAKQHIGKDTSVILIHSVLRHYLIYIGV